MSDPLRDAVRRRRLQIKLSSHAESSRGLALRAPRRAESDTKDSACTTAEHQAHRHVVENSQPEHEPNWNADQHAYNKPCADGRYATFLVVRHTIMVPNEPSGDELQYGQPSRSAEPERTS